MIAGVGGIVLLISLFLPWYGASIDIGGFSASESVNAWEAMSFIDILLFLCAVVAIAVVGARATGSLPPDVPGALVIFAAGALAFLLCVFRLIFIPDAGDIPDEVDLSRKIGAFLGVVASGAVGYAGWRQNAERPGGPGMARTEPAPPPPPTA